MFIDSHVERALEDTASSKLSYSDQDLRARSVHSPPRNGKKIRDPIELRYQILQVFLQARDTTLILVGNTPIPSSEKSPSMGPNCVAPLSVSVPSPLTFEILKPLVFFKYVLFETTRLQGPTWTSTSYRTPQHYPPQRRWPRWQVPDTQGEGYCSGSQPLRSSSRQRHLGRRCGRFQTPALDRQKTDVGIRPLSWWSEDMSCTAAGLVIGDLRACWTGERV